MNAQSTTPLVCCLFSTTLLIVSLASGCGADPAPTPTFDAQAQTGADGSSADAVTAGDASSSVDTGGGATKLDYAGESNVGSCAPNKPDSTRYAKIGFWKTTDCSGDPIKTNEYPINDTAGCYCWPGNSGENSADSFSCDATAKTVTIVQYNSLTCGAGDNTPTSKTFHLDECRQDIPPMLYSKVLDMGPCAD